MDKCRHQFTDEDVAELKKYRDKKISVWPSDSSPFLCWLKTMVWTRLPK
jgi:hypothetical protein